VLAQVASSSAKATDRDPLEISYGWSDNKDERAAVEEAVERMKQPPASEHAPKLTIVLSTSSKYDEGALHAALRKRLDSSTKIWGMTTPDRGLLTPAGRHLGISMMGVYASEMRVGVGQALLRDWKDNSLYHDVGKEAIKAALKDAGFAAGAPKPKIVLFAGLAFLTDNEIFRGIEEVIGRDIPIVGANPVGDDEWEIAGGSGYSTEAVKKNVITVAAIWAERRIGVAYGYGYRKTEFKGIATRSDAEKRILYEINRRPAADVYNEWVGGTLDANLIKNGGQIPFGVFAGNPFGKPIGDNPEDYVMLAPLRLNPDKSIFMSHEGIETGKEISVYKLDNDDVIVKPAIVATLAMAQGGVSRDELAGSFMLYCDAPFAGGKASLDGIVGPYYKRTNKPFIGFFASGEAGFSARGGNRTLAYSTISLVFGRSRLD
jgi:hypothetical protein